VITAILNVAGGPSQYATPLPSSNVDEGVRLGLLAAWHMSSVAICLSAGALVWAATRRQVLESRAMVLFVGLMWIGFGLCFFFVALTATGDGLVAKLIGQPIQLISPGTLALASQIHRASSESGATAEAAT
jgi:hypothetical protein